MIVGFDGVEMSTRLASLLGRLQPAGVILFARNIKSPEQTWRLLLECQKCVSTRLFTCVDLEGEAWTAFAMRSGRHHRRPMCLPRAIASCFAGTGRSSEKTAD